ncbi:MAG: hypothetical protein K0S65_5827 [Labilithrix sp.]|nr:hypothetical protein [Labilithrix sp.]
MRFSKTMASRTDDELIEILDGPPEDWEPEAVEAAMAESERRGIPLKQRSPATIANVSAQTKELAEAPLDGGTKFAAFVLGGMLSILGVLISLGISTKWRKEGARRKASDFVTWTTAGAGLSLLVAFARCGR